MSNRRVCTLTPSIRTFIQVGNGVLVVEGILTEHEEEHLDECFTQRALCCAHGRTIWEPHGKSFCKLARCVRMLQGCVILLEDLHCPSLQNVNLMALIAKSASTESFSTNKKKLKGSSCRIWIRYLSSIKTCKGKVLAHPRATLRCGEYLSPRVWYSG